MIILTHWTKSKSIRQPHFPGEGGFHRHDAHDESESDSEHISGPVIDLGAHASHEDSHAG